MLKTTQGVIVSVKVAAEETPGYKVKCSVTETVWVPIVAALLAETEITPPALIDTSAAVIADDAVRGTLLTE
jgi:hypothetical protein